MHNDGLPENGWDDETQHEVCLCGQCDECEHAIDLAFSTTRTAPVPSGCLMPSTFFTQVAELERMFNPAVTELERMVSL